MHFEGLDLITVGDDVHIDKYCIISTTSSLQGNVSYKSNQNFSYPRGSISIGSYIHICQGCIIMGHGGVDIASNSVLSSGCKIYSLTNVPNDPSNPSKVISLMPYSSSYYLCSPVVLQNNVWLGLNVIVMPSVTIGANSFCTSNSLVLKSFEENSYISGQPAVFVKRRFPK